MIDNQRAIFDLVNNILYIFTFSGKRKKSYPYCFTCQFIFTIFITIQSVY